MVLPEMSLLMYMYTTTGGGERGREGGREGVGERGEKEMEESGIRAKKDGTITK